MDKLGEQLALEEGNKNLVYDDATGRPFQVGDTLQGNLSVGVGINLMLPFDPEELEYLENHRIVKTQDRLRIYAWYLIQDEVRQGALTDLAYNLGVKGLLEWPEFLFYMGQKDYPHAVAEIKSNQRWLAQVHSARATRIMNEILTGQWGIA